MIPELTPEQLVAARTAASAARRRRAMVKEKLRAGDWGLAQVLELAQTDEVVAQAKVIDVLKAIPRVGETRAWQCMNRLEIAANRRLRGLGRHQITALKAEFPLPVAAR